MRHAVGRRRAFIKDERPIGRWPLERTLVDPLVAPELADFSFQRRKMDQTFDRAKHGTVYGIRISTAKRKSRPRRAGFFNRRPNRAKLGHEPGQMTCCPSSFGASPDFSDGRRRRICYKNPPECYGIFLLAASSFWYSPGRWSKSTRSGWLNCAVRSGAASRGELLMLSKIPLRWSVW